MSADRKAATAFGVPYVIGTVVFILSAAVTAGAVASQASTDGVAG